MGLPNELSVNLGLPSAPITENAELFSELVRVYNAIRILAQAVDIYTGQLSQPSDTWSYLKNSQLFVGKLTKIYTKAYEDIAYSNTVNIFQDAGEAKVRKAVSGSYLAHGYCANVDGATAGSYAEIILLGMYAKFSAGSLTPGNTYYQSTTPGVIGASGAQKIGFALSDTELFFIPQI